MDGWKSSKKSAISDIIYNYYIFLNTIIFNLIIEVNKMSLFQDILKLWRSDDLLSQAWNESYEMLNLSSKFFVQSVKTLRKQIDNKPIIALKKRDKEINEFQRDIRRKVMTHLVMRGNTTDVPTGLILINMVVDIERVGDYCKNILDLAVSTPKSLKSEKVSKELKMIEEEVLSRFDQTLKALQRQDYEVAQELIDTHRKMVTRVSDKLEIGRASCRERV